jgi:uncharacterized protein
MKSNNSNFPGPIEVKERIISLDIIRGFALLGILLINILSFSGLESLGVGEVSIDKSIYWFLQFFIRGKFISLFAILFGIGFALQISRFQKSGRGITLYWKRMIVLFIFGLLHLALDPLEVLNIYAICGILLLLFRNIPNKNTLIIAVVIMALPYLHLTIATLNSSKSDAEDTEIISQKPDVENSDSDSNQNDNSEIGWNLYSSEIAAKVFSEKGFTDVIKFNMDYAFNRRISSWVTWLWFLAVLPLMLIGFILGKLQLLENAMRNISLFKKVFWIGIGLGVLGTWLSNFLIGKVYTEGWNPWFSFASGLIWSISNVILTLAYCSGILLLLQKSFWQKLLSPLISYGRMALTNYLLQTIICVCFFYGFGLNFFGKFKLVFVILIALGIHLLLIFVSSIWLKYFRYGPFEWLWRYLTYGKV